MEGAVQEGVGMWESNWHGKIRTMAVSFKKFDLS